MKTTILACNAGGIRLDVFLSGTLPGLTRNAAQKLLEAGRVTLNGETLRKNHKTICGQKYMVEQDEPGQSAILAQDIRLDIVYEDNDVVVVNKPRGMVVHPAPGHSGNTLVNALLHHCGRSLSGIGGVLRPGIVHRLDKDTSGLIIAAKNDKAHLSLSSQLSARELTREYDAVVCGIIKPDAGIVNAPLGRHPKDRKKQAVIFTPGAREAITHYEVITRYSEHTHIHCRLETGRTHQIRVHMAYLGHPLLGDLTYGYKRKYGSELPGGQCLHASKLRFIHPCGGKQMVFQIPLPEYFRHILENLAGELQIKK